MKPIKEVIELEEISARRLLEVEREKSEVAILEAASSDDAIAREKARSDAIHARVAEGRLVREARQNVIALLTSSKTLLEGFEKWAPKVSKAIQDLEIGIDIDAESAARLLWRIATSSKAASTAGLEVLQMERLLLGQPMEIIGVRDMDEATETDALKELEEAAKAADRIRARRARRQTRLRLLQGGKTAASGNGQGNVLVESGGPYGAPSASHNEKGSGKSNGSGDR